MISASIAWAQSDNVFADRDQGQSHRYIQQKLLREWSPVNGITLHADFTPSQPYCKRAKQLIQSIPDKKSPPKIYELDQMGEQGTAIQAYLLQKTGQRTVPNVFIGKKHIGGSDILSELHEQGELAKLVMGYVHLLSSNVCLSCRASERYLDSLPPYP